MRSIEHKERRRILLRLDGKCGADCSVGGNLHLKRPEPKVRETKKPTTSPLGKRAPKATLSEAKAGGAKAAKAKVAKPAKAKKFRR